jgi:hypothetical protein
VWMIAKEDIIEYENGIQLFCWFKAKVESPVFVVWMYFLNSQPRMQLIHWLFLGVRKLQ